MSFPFDEPSSVVHVPEFVDPQYTVMPYATTLPGLTTPEPSPTEVTSRRESFAFSEDRRTSFCGSSAASSFVSYPGCGTPSLSTPGSSASSSRRQSILVPESQKYFFSTTSPSPSNRPQRPMRIAATDQYSLQELSPQSYTGNTDMASLITDGAAACVTGGDFTMIVDDLMGKTRQLQSYNTSSSFYGRIEQDVQMEEMISCQYDLAHVRGSHALDFDQPLFSHAQPTVFRNSPSQPDGEAYHTQEHLSTPLAPPFEYVETNEDTDTGCADKVVSFSEVFKEPSPERICPGGKNFKKRPNQRRECLPEFTSYKLQLKNKNHRCREKHCIHAFDRQEHLKRHEASKHGKPAMLPCEFPGCIDRKTGGQREIIARPDNLKAHYLKTHFKYGSSEKGGKNVRKSMKEAHEIGLSEHDSRWAILVQGKMNVNEEIKDFLHVWKMIGYSIRETRDIKVKDKVSDWQGPEDATLQKFDPRWKALWDGTLTFDKAMNRGAGMKESDAQGLLGVTMLETEAMGIDRLDPRWQELRNARMSVEQSEKLGVKHRNPVWRRRAR